MKLNRTGSLWDRNQRNGINENWQIIEGDYKNIVDNVSNKAYQQVVDNAKLNWKEPVNSYSNLPSSATKGDTRMTRDTGKVYRYSGTAWQEIQQIDAGPVNELDSRVSSQLAQTDKKTLGIPLAKMSNTTVEENYTGVLPITFHDGWLYGFRNNTTIVRSNDDGKSWTTVATSPQGSLHSIYWTNDGEVLLGFNSWVYKSSGWSNNPQTATWKTVVNKSKGIGILPWGIDGDGKKFIVTEYSASDRSESRYVWISTDMGETFNIVIDKYDIDPDNTSHMHGVCYDRWADRFFLSHGHGIIEGVYWSDDDGITWNLVNADFELNASPTTLTATDNGIVAGSDSGRAGLYGIQRTENPHDMVMRRTARWQVSQEGVTGFAYRGVRDEETGQVYVAIKSDFTDISPVIMAGTATTGSVVWKDSVGSPSPFQYLTVTDKYLIAVHGNSGNYKLIKDVKPTQGVPNFDGGNIQTGLATSTSIGIGQNVDVTTPNEIIIGNNAKQAVGSGGYNVVLGDNASGGSQGVTIGSDAKSEAGFTTAIGKNVIAKGENSIAIGKGASIGSGGSNSVALGTDATVEGTSSVAFGGAAFASGLLSVAIGASSVAGNSSISLGRRASTGNGTSVAIGEYAKSHFSNAVALGSNTESTAANQLQIGERHIELSVSPITAGPIGVARIYLKENTDGKQELCIRFRNGEVVLATQP